ncbi:MAG: DUF4235 domain-containing protein [Streptosporangiaceae bacterium]|jgi:hypothetical protein|nr:hypothetical protein [Actinomycetota bacterium]
MSGKGGGTGAKAANALAGAAAAFGTRKLIVLAWRRITGNEPPDHPEDPKVALLHAVIFGMVVGASVNVARVLATRATSAHFAVEDSSGGPE